MEGSLVKPLLSVMLAGILGGSVLAPLKYQRGWRFERTWLLYSICAYLISPWVVGLETVPGLLAVYTASGAKVTGLTALFGFGWGLAVVLNGYGVLWVGLAVTTGILMGSSIAIGSILALLLVEPSKLWTAAGARLVLLDLGLLAGVSLCSWAGYLRERHQPGKTETSAHGRAKKGILVCLIAGLLSTLFNVALTYGRIISQHAEAAGASSYAAANAVWAIAVSAGSLPSILWCWWALRGSPNLPVPAKSATWRNTLRCVLMSILWIGGTVLYGAATRMMGPAGTALGWPVYMSGMIVTAGFWSLVSGEWQGAGRRPARIMLTGLALLVVFVALTGWLGSGLV